MSDLRLVAAGDSVLLAEFDERIDPELNRRVIALADAVERARIAGVRDAVPTFRSVAVYFDPLTTDYGRLASLIRELAGKILTPDRDRRAPIEIPVCYDGECGPDLDDVASFGGASLSETIAMHTAPVYHTFMLGFLPGFAYLGVVDPRIAAPRRVTPRTRVAAGSVGIAGQQTAVYPVDSPGGWNIIGRTPLQMFVPSSARPTRVRPGDTVRFRAIDRTEFERRRAEAQP